MSFEIYFDTDKQALLLKLTKTNIQLYSTLPVKVKPVYSRPDIISISWFGFFFSKSPIKYAV